MKWFLVVSIWLISWPSQYMVGYSMQDRVVSELPPSASNARRLLEGFPGGADRWLFPEARVDRISVINGDLVSEPRSGFAVALIVRAPFAQVRDYYESACKELVKGKRNSLTDDGMFVTTFDGHVIVIGDDDNDGEVNITLSANKEPLRTDEPPNSRWQRSAQTGVHSSSSGVARAH